MEMERNEEDKQKEKTRLKAKIKKNEGERKEATNFSKTQRLNNEKTPIQDSIFCCWRHKFEAVRNVSLEAITTHQLISYFFVLVSN
jgi:hypothetical protein